MSYDGPERRTSTRVKGRFMVSYCVCNMEDVNAHFDISQTKNIGGGGMLIITNRKFEPGTKLVVNIRLPFKGCGIKYLAKVLESMEVVKDLIYDTRVKLEGFSKENKEALGKTLEYYIKQDGTNGPKE